MLIDTHCHLDFKDFDSDRDEVIDRARAAGVGKIINVASSIEGARRSVELAGKYDMVHATVGVHPHDAASVTDKVMADLGAMAKDSKVVAVGEVGLDYYRNLSPKEAQVSAFKRFIHLARDLDLPLVIHSRDAQNEALDILAKENKGGVGVVMHCFAGDSDFLQKCLDMDMYISFTASLTFKNAKNLREVAKSVPVERLMLETDAPFLAPQEHRGKRNEPAYLAYLVDEWSKIMGLSKEDIARITTHNANSFFSLKLDGNSKIAYEIRDSLYLNITNRCTNACEFCVRTQTNFVKGHNLKLDSEPSVEELIDAAGDPRKYKEIVFCGYGEPTMRLDAIKAVAKELKSRGARIRLITNGHGDLINGRNITKEIAGLIDRVSVSLNAETESKYNDICKPKFGVRTYKKILEFIKSCVGNKIEVEVTCLNLPQVDVKKCEMIAKELGARFRLRSYGVVG